MLTAPGGYPVDASWAPAGTGLEVATPAEAERAVTSLADRGSAAIKVSLNAEAGPTPTDAVISAIAEAAHARELPVTAHAQGEGQVERALGAGLDELAHAPWTHRLSDDVIEAAGSRMRIVSTLGIHPEGGPGLAIALENLARFHRAGGRTLYGTDLGNGPVPNGISPLELQRMHVAGMGTEEVLQALVRSSIEVGAPADLVVLDDSPLGGLEAFDDLRVVIRAGRVVSGADRRAATQ